MSSSSSNPNPNMVPPRAIGRTIAGVLSGAAANLRSRFAILGQQPSATSSSDHVTSLPATLPSMVTPVSDSQLAFQGEQLPSMLPVMVPGATESLNQSFPSSKSLD